MQNVCLKKIHKLNQLLFSRNIAFINNGKISKQQLVRELRKSNQIIYYKKFIIIKVPEFFFCILYCIYFIFLYFFEE